jgi:hypothetical protein
MSLTTLDAITAGMQYPREFIKGPTGTLVAGRPHSLWYLPGIPGAGNVPASGIGGEILTPNVPGQLPFSNPVSGNSYLGRLQAMATQAGTLQIADRIWQNSGIDVTSTAEQTFTGAARIPNRDANGSNVGDGVYCGIEVSGALGVGTPVITIKYINTSGQTKTAVNVVATVASSIQGTFYPVGLAAGDTGIQQLVSIQLSATMTSGTISAVLYRPLARLELVAAFTPNAIDALTAGFPRMYNDTVPWPIFWPSTTTTSVISGQFIFTQG